MIVVQQTPKRVEVTVYGEFTLADFKEFEEAVRYKIKFEGSVDLLFNFSEMADCTIDVAWEDLVFARQHPDDFNKIAVVTDSQWVTWSAWLSLIFVDAELKVFRDEQDARAWLEVSGEEDV